MRRITRGGVAVAALVGATLALSACAPATSTPDADSGTLVIDKSFDLVTADPARMFETTGGIVLHPVYDSLLTFADGDATKPLPSVASGFEVNDDATVYTFTIRDDITFSDDSALTAADVIYSLNRVKNIKGNGSFLMDGLTVTAGDDDSTVIITSAVSNTAIPAIVTSPTLGIVNSAVVTENGGTDAEGADTADTAEDFLNGESAGSGPYMIDTFDTTTETVLVANPNYWGDAPAYDKIVLRNATAETQLADIQSGTADIALDLGSDQIGSISSNPDVVVTTSSSPTIFFLFANADAAVSPITSNPDFREAVKYGLDYEAILDLAGDGAARAFGVVPNSFLGALGEDDAVETDLDKAKAAVERLGDVGTVSLEYPSDISSNGLDFGPFAERIQSQLADIGLNIELTPSPVASALETYRGGTEQMGLWLWNPDYPDSADYLAFGPGGIVGLRAGWTAGSASELESIMTAASTETDESAREGLFVDFQNAMNEEGVIIPLVQPAASVVSSAATGAVNYDAVFSLDIAAIK